MKKLFYFDPENRSHISKIKKVAASYAKNAEEAVMFAGLFTLPIEDWYHCFSDEETLSSVHIIFKTQQHGRYKLSLYSEGWSSHYAL